MPAGKRSAAWKCGKQLLILAHGCWCSATQCSATAYGWLMTRYVDALLLLTCMSMLLLLLQVLCTTSTLAMGVNLPAHLVVSLLRSQHSDSASSQPSALRTFNAPNLTCQCGAKQSLRVCCVFLQVLKGTTRYAGEAEAGPGEAAGYKEYTQTEVRHTWSGTLHMPYGLHWQVELLWSQL